MAFYTFYCNEKILLDNWEYYNETNHVLRNLLRRTTLTPEECAAEYYEKMKNKSSVSYDHDVMINKFKHKLMCDGQMREIKQVTIYKSDIDYIINAKKKYHLPRNLVHLLFSVIFFCRLYNGDTLKLDTQFKLQSFCSATKERLYTITVNKGSWENCYYTIKGLDILSDEYKLLERLDATDEDCIGCNFKYPAYNINAGDSVAYIYTVTKENNNPDLSSVCEELIDGKVAYCVICGTEYRPKLVHTSRYCDVHRAEVEKIKHRINVIKYRERQRLKNSSQNNK